MFKNLLNEAQIVRSILPFLHPDYNTIFEELIKKGASIELLLPKTIAMVFIRSMNSEILQQGLNSGNVKIKSLNGDVKVALTVANNFMSMGLFKIDGSYDQNRILVSYEEKAMEWANNLFKKYNNTGKKLYLYS